MKRTLPLIAISAVTLAAPLAAEAHKKRGHKHSKATPAKVYKANLGPVGTDAAYAGIEGKAQLVDGRKNDKISIHVRGLKPGTTYPWHVHEAADGVANPCAQGAAQGPVVTAFRYRALKARPSGNANSKGTSRTFKRDPEKKYYVNVHDPASGAPIACGVLKSPKKAKRKARGRGHSKAHTRGKSQTRERGQSQSRERGKSRTRGRS